MDVQAPCLSKRDTKHVHFIVNKENILVCAEESLLRRFLGMRIFLALSVIWLFLFFFFFFVKVNTVSMQQISYHCPVLLKV